ncbi:CRISPR-associated endonuclease Cas1 [Sphingopyxis sp. OPL5]|uniref:CRISPR-associated endonuclease Cas1 n=1 Tax=Sphingopyxis sp. OPL5 TaxID=2486273 RepID=UPI00165708C6|nr:CRISPR-associated endonuclease Cas1 [Sphingopyxis sp. OPL5]QNO26708.1 CRISPR-associated endonuclease Cas1 [Sphingopyxis sp. OPL5]
MLLETQFEQSEMADEWAIRSDNWIAELGKLQKPRRLRERNPNALILTGHGNSLRVENGSLIIKQGFTHYPQKQECHRLLKGDLDLPRIIMLLDGSGSLSFDVLDWLSEQSIALARIKGSGDVAIVASGNGFASDQSKIDWQRETLACPVRRMAFVQELIQSKLTNSLETLSGHLPRHADTDAAIAGAKRGITALDRPLHDMQQVRAIEGECASLYFRAWRNLRPQWKISKRYPVPESWLTYRGRSSVHECKPENRRATDPINAMLNYGYAVMHSKLQIKAVADGYSPLLGIMHRQKRSSASYILDMLEPERPRVDAAILDFVQSRTFSGADFILRKDGACRLSPQLARVVAALII